MPKSILSQDILRRVGSMDAVSIAYKNYIEVTANGVVRLDQNTPAPVVGASTSFLRVCFGVILYLPEEKRVSLIHHYTCRTDPSSYDEEVRWVSKAKPANVKVILAVNKKMMLSQPTHRFNIMNDIKLVETQLQASGISPANISTIEANDGAVSFNRQTQECTPHNQVLSEAEFIGTPYPYINLRRRINDFQAMLQGQMVLLKKVSLTYSIAMVISQHCLLLQEVFSLMRISTT
jgi:hypothetical protein